MVFLIVTCHTQFIKLPNKTDSNSFEKSFIAKARHRSGAAFVPRDQAAVVLDKKNRNFKEVTEKKAWHK